MLSRTLPVVEQFFPMKDHPLEHESFRAARKLTVDRPCFNLNRHLVLAVDRVKVRYAMFVVKHADHDAQET